MFPVIKITDSLNLPVYLLIVSLIYTFSLFWIIKRSEKLNFSREHTLNLSLMIMLGGFLGARLLHVLYEEPLYYKENISNIFKFWQGGFVFYGGAIGAFVFSFTYINHKKISFHKWADFFTPVFSLGYVFGRIACFLNGCCYGKVCDLPWAIQFPNLNDGLGRHPTQLYAVVFELLLFISILYFDKKRSSFSFLKYKGQLFFYWATFHAVGRILMEAFRDDFRGAIFFGMSISTWISLSIIMATSHYLFHNRNKAQ